MKYLLHMQDFCLLHYFLSSDSEAMTHYPTAVLYGLRIVALFNKLYFYKKRLLELLIFNQETSIPVPYSNKTPWFRFSSDQHNYKTSSSAQGNLIKLFYKTKRYGKYSITVSESWNKIKKQLKDLLFRDLSPNK